MIKTTKEIKRTISTYRKIKHQKEKGGKMIVKK